MRSVHAGPLTVLPGVGLLLGLLAAAVGLGVPALVTGVVLTLSLWLLLERGLRRHGLDRLGPANTVTLVRAGLVVAITALVVQSWAGDVPVPLFVALSSIALLLDLVDGWLARAKGAVTAFGAAFDMETDAFLILVLSVYVVPVVGAWVLLIGLARYLLLVATAIWPWLAGPVPTRRWAKVVAAIQGIVLVAAAADVLPTRWTQALVAVALLLLAESFGRQVLYVRRHRREHPLARPTWVRPVFNGVAVAILWLALILPRFPQHLGTPALVAIPVELLVFLVLSMVLPPVWGRVLAVLAGLLLAAVVAVTILDLGFYAAFDRPFNPLTDPAYLGSGLDLLHAYAHRSSDGVIAAALLFVAAGAALCVWAAVRTRRTVHGAPRAWGRVVAALAVVWLVAGVGGAQVSGVSVAASPAAGLVVSQVDELRAALHDRATFERDVAHDPYRATPGRDLLTGLRGKDVLVVFVESYGRVAVENSWFAPQVDRTLSSMTAKLGRDGFAARSGWLTSPTYGGISWLAHSTLQSGLWIDSQQRYDQVLGSRRLTLASAFGRAGWDTVGDIPSDAGPWPDGKRFYRYDRMYDAADVGYRGPRLGYARIPDQYSLRAFAQRELVPQHSPVMAEIDLDSSHTPWLPLPKLLPWNSLGDGSVYNGLHQPEYHALASALDGHTTQAHYARSIRYSLRSLAAFVHHSHDPNLVMVVLGDHQPHTVVSGFGASHDVPVSLVAKDPAVLKQNSGWGWTAGMQPASTVPSVPMNDFRDRFLEAFGSTRTGH